jgi:hypothetical protein
LETKQFASTKTSLYVVKTGLNQIRKENVSLTKALLTLPPVDKDLK